MYCTNCGERRLEESNFCTRCGKKFDEINVKKEVIQEDNGMKTTSIVLGILGMIASGLIVLFPIGIILSIIGLILAICSIKKSKNTIGIVLNSVGLTLSIIWCSLFILFISYVSSEVEDNYYDYDYSEEYGRNDNYYYERFKDILDEF